MFLTLTSSKKKALSVSGLFLMSKEKETHTHKYISTYSGPSLIRTTIIQPFRLSRLVMTVQLESLVGSVHFNGVFE